MNIINLLFIMEIIAFKSFRFPYSFFIIFKKLEFREVKQIDSVPSLKYQLITF